MKKSIQFTLLFSFLVFGCSPKAPQPAEQAAPEVQSSPVEQAQEVPKADGAEQPDAEAAPAKKAEEATEPSVKNEPPNASLRPFRFTVDLEKFYQQKRCNEETGNCKTYEELYPMPEIVIHVQEVPNASIKFDLDCDGDGAYEFTGLTESTVCKYSEKTGKHQISIRGDIPGLVLCGDDEEEPDYGFSNALAVVSVDQWGDIRWKTMREFAANCLNITLPPKEAPNLGEVTDMSSIFQGALHFNQSIEHWDISHVTNLSRAFTAAFAFNQSLAKWNTSNVTDISYMFMLARKFDQPLESWDVSHVTDMAGVFSEAGAFNRPLAKWNVAGVKNMDGMFRGATSFNQSLETWDVSQVRNMDGMFNRAASFNQPLDKWDVSGVRRMNAMFWGATGFKQNIDAWKVSASCDTGNMFRDSGRKDLPKWYRE